MASSHSDSSVPKHLAIIMDGNRRFSKRLMAQPWKGHEWGAEKLEKLLVWCGELGISELTVYAFSVQNFERPKEEFDALMRIFKSSFQKLKARFEDVNDKPASVLCIRFIGRLEMFPADIQKVMREIVEISRDHKGMLFNVALGYGGREEMIDAMKRIGERVARGELLAQNIDGEVIANSLYMRDEPDLVIRTGGERRTSNFLIWQSYYSEWYFTDKLWPEFEKEDLIAAIQSYSARERRYGK